ncbi:tRNA (guanine-N2)-dimethyltransferase [Desulfohalobiaceae bacterium Ax17]|uniref:TrmH family RNA methyltransferase n=1 Tax=Desulfovulcanus ferrireducens TaxID=2831190 RepID=UPI0025A3D944|nr:TrmH family RNA methyltransferase [Desulfovulcanus ferrireducens]MBT8763437.1 tRNA (guanine-N2)-dimethyltransferase [Desulfovulcanus ferrireducens]
MHKVCLTNPETRIQKPRTEKRLNRISQVLARRQKDLTLIINNVHDPHNVSAILRSCDAFGVQKVHLYYSQEAFPCLGKKSSASAKKWVDCIRHRQAEKMVTELKEQGFKLVGTGFSERAVPLTEWDFTKPTAVILGNEHRGMDEELLALVPNELYIPMQGMVQSLNVSVAAAIILYEAWRQRQAKGMYGQPSFSEEELKELFEQWAMK